MKNASTTIKDSRGIATQQRNSTIRPSLRLAINRKCREFIYDPNNGDGSWRKQVSACTSKTCPLYSVRPKPANGITRELNALENPKNDRFTASFDSAGGVA